MAKRIMGENQKTFKDVGKVLRQQGVQFRLNVMECCRGCISHEKLGLKSEDQPYGFIYGGQGGRVAWNEQDEMVYASSMNRNRSRYYRAMSNKDRKVDTLYVNHGNNSAEKIVEAFQNAGFDAEWDGEDYSCVEVHVG